MQTYLLIAGGLVLLIAGGEMLVRGAARAAVLLGMSPLLIGLTLVSFGTSAPELVTSVEASLLGAPGIAIGNIVGSNIANILLILGVAALLAPIAVSRQALMRDGGIVLASAVAFIAIGYLLPLNRLVGGLLIASLVVYLYAAYRQEMAGASADPSAGHSAAHDKRDAHDEVFPVNVEGDAASAGLWPSIILALVGLVVIVFGGKLLVEGAVDLARTAGVSETVIGLTIVAIGTSLPELVTSAIAALRGHSDVALGNVLGSNIYNILFIGGATGLIAPTVIPSEVLYFDGLVMIAVSVAVLVMARSGFRISRMEGAALLAAYGVYLYTLWPA